jgi:hypothetical protein
MVMKKIMQSKDEVLVLNEGKKEFPKGYRFLLGSNTYTVIKRHYEDNTEMRELVDTQGNIEFVTLDTLRKDAQEADFKILEPNKDIEKSLD